MRTRFECIGIACVVAVGIAAARNAPTGYLATVGPSALRFQIPSFSASVLPPLDLEDNRLPSTDAKEAVAQEPQVPAQELQLPWNSVERQNDDVLGPLTNSSNQQATSTAAISMDPAVMTPSFLRFFVQLTNTNQIASAFVPLVFRPAQPDTRAPSSIRYTSNK